MAAKSSAVDGRLLKWARTQRARTMRWIQDMGGPSVGLQSEVEQQRRNTVTQNTLKKWVEALHVTEEFARGELPRYYENPAACAGLARDIAPLIGDPLPDGTDLGSIDPMGRAREVLGLIAGRSGRLPTVALAYVLGLEFKTLEQLLSGQLPISAALLNAIMQLTTIPEGFFKRGVLVNAKTAPLQEYFPAMRIAAKFAIPPEEVEELVITHALAECETRGRPTGSE